MSDGVTRIQLTYLQSRADEADKQLKQIMDQLTAIRHALYREFTDPDTKEILRLYPKEER